MLGGVAAFFEELARAGGPNFSIFYDRFDLASYLRGVMTTLELSTAVVVGSILVGVVMASIRLHAIRPVKWAIAAYVMLFRNTPQLAQLYFFYYGVGALMPEVTGPGGAMQPLFDNFTWCVIAFSLTGGAFNAEILRAGLQAVPKEMHEAAETLGYSRGKALLFIIWPLAIRICLPALNNNLVTLIKSTTIAYAIGVREVLEATTTIMLSSSNVVEMMTVLLLTFLTIVSIWSTAMRWLERRLKLPGFGA